jgi:PAS domain S-box-containing protein
MLILVEKVIAELFPFGFIMDENLEIINKGKSFIKFHAEKNQFADIFEIEKPRIVLKGGFKTITKNAGRVFILTMKEHVPELKLKGTFISDMGKSLIFLGYPQVKNYQDLLVNHLDQNDFGVIDSTIDLITELRKSENSVENLKKVNSFLAIQAEQLKIKEEELKNFFMLSLDFMCLANTEGYFLKINPTFSKVLGYTEHDLLSKTFLSFVHPDDLEMTLHEIEKLSHGHLTINFENRYRKSDGTYI